ncbi:hypothetical protein PQX77_020488 [Marasmius sp. AFHP31]|nr:hypothetical protein PQX77_020488 [Marasmius sp. AFHP31]
MSRVVGSQKTQQGDTMIEIGVDQIVGKGLIAGVKHSYTGKSVPQAPNLGKGNPKSKPLPSALSALRAR